MSRILVLLAAALLFAQCAQAKEIAVFMPVVGPLTPFEQAALGKDAAAIFSARFDLKYGEEVDHFVKQVFQDESKKKDCDEVNCYRRIAARYHADKIVALRVTRLDKTSYLVTSHLYDVPTGEMVTSQKAECTQCSFEKLQVLCNELSRQVAQGK